jgi:hypothetical protein
LLRKHANIRTGILVLGRLLRPPTNYVRPSKGGLILGGYEADPVQYNMATMLEDFTIDHLALDLGVLRRLAISMMDPARAPTSQRNNRT